MWQQNAKVVPRVAKKVETIIVIVSMTFVTLCIIVKSIVMKLVTF